MPRPLVVSNRWVPSGSGTPIVLYELFRHFPPDSVHVVAGPGIAPKTDTRLPFETTRLSIPFSARADRVIGAAYRRAGALTLPFVRAVLRRIVEREKPPAIYAHYPDAVFVTAAALTAEEAGIPLTIYFDILWGGNDEPGLAERYETRVCRIAKHRFAITETYCEHLGKKHGVPFELLPHVITAPAERVVVPPDARRDVVHLGGNVYVNMNLDAVQDLHRALAAMPSPPALEIFGFTKKEELAAWGLDGPFVRTGTVPRSELLGIQKKSRVLYLPEAFRSPTPEMIEHNFPTKALEYMLTGTPILVHAPRACYLARSAREHGWGILVDEPGPEAIGRGLARVLAGGPDVDATIERAFAFVASRDGRTWSKRLMAALAIHAAAA